MGQLTKASNAARKATTTLRRSPVAGTSGDLSTKAGGEFRNFEKKHLPNVASTQDQVKYHALKQLGPKF